MPFMDTAAQLSQQVTVTTAARLHMGFYDLSQSTEPGFAGLRFGGLGLALDAPSTHLQFTKSKKLEFDANCSENVVKIVENIIKSLNLAEVFSLNVLQKIPEHTGLGSGTQMALAIGAGLSALFSLNLCAQQIAIVCMRGRRSGIGLGAFSQGGLLIDSGKIANELPSIDMRFDFPDHWRVLLVQDSAHVGVHGAVELEAFKTLKPAQFNLKNMLQQHMLPALQRRDLLAFGAHMQDLQAYNGDYFAPIQGGRFASKSVADVLSWLQANGATCVGQSSWGPTGFAILENLQQADLLHTQARLAFKGKPNISFSIVRGKNTGANIQLG
jgi:beta-ribofuranosylaminobenzene 5'-phosphate synthase